MKKNIEIENKIETLLNAIVSADRGERALASGIAILEQAQLANISGGRIAVDPTGSTCEAISQGVSDMTKVDD